MTDLEKYKALLDDLKIPYQSEEVHDCVCIIVETDGAGSMIEADEGDNFLWCFVKDSGKFDVIAINS